MGILQLMNLIKEKAPGCIRKLTLDFYTGRAIGVDASMSMYQFLIQTQGYNQQDKQIVELTDKDGNKTGHLVGLFNRTLQFLENGIKPVWVFDGKPPTMKGGELAKRRKAKEEAKEKTEQALEQGDMEMALMQNQRNVYITQTMKQDAIKMLRLMGCPVIEAPCEAEAQCAELTRANKTYATATDDMDALTFRSAILLKGFNTKKEPIVEITYQTMLEELGLNYEEFVDLCILVKNKKKLDLLKCGCDYTEKIEGIGPVTAYKLIKEFKCIENILEHIHKENLVKQKYKIPERFLYEDSRELFMKPNVTEASSITLSWNKPDEDSLIKFLVEEKGFNEKRVISGLKRIENKDTKGLQPRMENFFGKSVKVQSDMAKSSTKKPVDKKNRGKKIV